MTKYIVNDYNNRSIWWQTFSGNNLFGTLKYLVHQLRKSGMSLCFFFLRVTVVDQGTDMCL